MCSHSININIARIYLTLGNSLDISVCMCVCECRFTANSCLANVWTLFINKILEWLFYKKMPVNNCCLIFGTWNKYIFFFAFLNLFFFYFFLSFFFLVVKFSGLVNWWMKGKGRWTSCSIKNKNNHEGRGVKCGEVKCGEVRWGGELVADIQVHDNQDTDVV